MKKFYTMALMALVVTAPLLARELKFFNGTTELEQGATVESSEYTVEAIGNGMVEVTFAPELFLWSDIFTNSVTLTANCVSGQLIQFCPGGECVTGTTVTKDNITVQRDQKLPLLYEYIGELGETEDVPDVVTELEAVDSRHTDVKADVTIVMRSKSAVSEIFMNNSNFKAVKGGINYKFDGMTAVSLFTISGEKVYEKAMKGAGTINTTALPAGVYVYKIGKQTGKIYIR